MQAYGGRAAALWFLLGIALVEILSIACCYRRRTPEHRSRPEHGDKSSDDTAGAKSTEVRVENVEKDAGKSGRTCRCCFTGQNSMPTPVLGQENVFPLPTQLHNRTTILALHSVESTRVYHRPPL